MKMMMHENVLSTCRVLMAHKFPPYNKSYVADSSLSDTKFIALVFTTHITWVGSHCTKLSVNTTLNGVINNIVGTTYIHTIIMVIITPYDVIFTLFSVVCTLHAEVSSNQ